MEFEKYFKETCPQKQIDKLGKKYKDKKIMLYGAGKFFREVYENYDFSALNIIGICDRSFIKQKDCNCSKYAPYSFDELKDIDFDVLALSVLEPQHLFFDLNKKLNLDNGNNIKIIPLIRPKKSKIFHILLNSFK